MGDFKDKISAALNRSDPEGLIKIGAPFDEYDFEAELVEELVNENILTFKAFVRVFEHAFSKDIKDPTPYKKAYEEVVNSLMEP